MDTNLVFGALALLFGVTTLLGRIFAPNSALFSKLEPMKKQFGDKAGNALHVVSYTVVPIVVGLVLIATVARRG